MSISLKPFNTFGIESHTVKLVEASTANELVRAWQDAHAAGQPTLILGEGSNVLFIEDFSGVVILNRIQGVTVKESADAWHIYSGAGENWHQLVEYTLAHDMPGLENLALIPGCVGSSPIQNIGAYGVELRQVCEYVDCVELATGELRRLTVAECRFGYRDSIFKHDYQQGFAIVGVGLRLKKQWQPVLTYGELVRLEPENVTPRQIFDAVCHMRRTKLPDPQVNGNAGSFFKNPVVTMQEAQALLTSYPTTPHYPQTDGTVKLAAGWLIDQCQLKGYRIGGAAVHRQQALVLINEENATADDVVSLARYVRQTVGQKFNIWLEPEVRFIASGGEVNAVETIS